MAKKQSRHKRTSTKGKTFLAGSSTPKSKKFIPPLQRRPEEAFTTPPEVRKLNLQYKAGLKQLQKLKNEIGEGWKTDPRYKAAREKNLEINRQANKLKKEFQQKKGVGQFGKPKEEKPKTTPEKVKEVFKQVSKEKEIIKKGLAKKSAEVKKKQAKKKQITLDRSQIVREISQLTAQIRLAQKKGNVAEESLLTKKRIKLRQQAKELKK
jgi:hypothetical protein